MVWKNQDGIFESLPSEVAHTLETSHSSTVLLAFLKEEIEGIEMALNNFLTNLHVLEILDTSGQLNVRRGNS